MSKYIDWVKKDLFGCFRERRYETTVLPLRDARSFALYLLTEIKIKSIVCR